MSIRVLDAATIGRIAAGEVVERPASIAKELIENAMDAGATAITVEIRDGGVNYLRVTDNGCGIAPNEVRVAFENHATSKILSGDELSDIRTLGFRGEALPSIASVSRITMTTRMKDQDAGCRITLEGGRITEFTDAGCPQGTTIVVKDLFFNTPVRREFLKKPSTEASAVTDLVAKMILGNPGVSIRMINAGRTLYHSYGDGDVRHAALTVYGRETAQKLFFMDQSEGALRLSGLIGMGEQARSNRAHQFFYINGRVVRCPQMTQALEEATKGRIMIGMYPMCALSLTLPPHSVDINVHPSKMEVRFRDESMIRERVCELIARSINQGKMLDVSRIEQEKKEVLPHNRVEVKVESVEQQSLFTIPQPKPVIKTTVEAAEKATLPSTETCAVAEKVKLEPVDISVEPVRALHDSAPVVHQPTGAILAPLVMPSMKETDEIRQEKHDFAVSPSVVFPASKLEKVAAPSPSSDKKIGPLRIIGVFSNTYILAESGDILLMIDQHAAHERLLYERFSKALEQGRAMQQLLTPIVLNLSPSECDMLIKNQQLLYEAGYEIEPFGERSIRMLAVPHVLGKADINLLFMELIDHLSLLKSATIEKRRAEVIQASCKHAVKGGEALTEEEIVALVEQMLQTDAPATCPHGRPVYKAFKKTEIEKMFKRIT